MDSAKNVRRLCRDYVWNARGYAWIMQGICMHGMCMDYVRGTHGVCLVMQHAWSMKERLMRGACTNLVWIVHRRCMDYVWIMYEQCVERTWIMHGLGKVYVWNAWNTLGLQMDYAWFMLDYVWGLHGLHIDYR